METMSGLSLSQFERLTRLAGGMHGRKVLIRTPKHGIAGLGKSRAYYTIHIVLAEDPDDHSAVELVPCGGGGVASSRLRNDSYAYKNGDALFRVAVEAAWELASALGLG